MFKEQTNRARYIRLVDIGWTNLSRGVSFYLTAAYFQQRLTPCSLGCHHPHAVGSGGQDFSDSAVVSASECLTHTGSESVPLDRRSGQVYKYSVKVAESINSRSIFPPTFEKVGFLRGIR
jgi:hypothetical protein